MKHELRVVHLAAYGGAYPGSFIPLLRASRHACEAQGWRFEVVFTPGVQARPWYGDLVRDGVTAHVAPELGGGRATHWLHTLLGRDRGPTLLHTHFSFWDLPSALLGALRPRTRVVWHLHSFLGDGSLARAKNLVRFGVVGRQVDRILCVGPEVWHKALARRAPPARTEVFPVGIDLDRLTPVSAEERAAERGRLGLAADRLVLLLFGRDWEQKGGPLALATVRELRARGHDAVAVVIDAPSSAEADLAPLERHGGILRLRATDEPRELFAAADVFLAASVVEGMGLAPIESMACGTPVVASDVPSLRHTAGAMPACRFAARAAGPFADAIEAELSAADDRPSRVAQSRQAIADTYSLQSWERRLVDLYSQLQRTRAR